MFKICDSWMTTVTEAAVGRDGTRVANARTISCSEFTGGNRSTKGLLFIRLQKSLEYKRQYEYNYIGNNTRVRKRLQVVTS
jgi:hypothetical protein